MGNTVTEHELIHLGRATERYAPDGIFFHVSGQIGMGFQPYHTHIRSHLESEPATDTHGNVLALDGRLDNHDGLKRALGITEQDVPDSMIVLQAFMQWGDTCFSKFIGDWALSLWSAGDHQLYLARDHAGTRTLYFGDLGDAFQWSTYLETLVTNHSTYSLDEEFVASYLGMQPNRNLTPYKNIRAVYPGHYLVVANQIAAQRPHWQWMDKTTIRYKTDGEYSEHFLTLFAQSVARRTGPGAPILAELSGGMDSTSIVCMSDHIRRSQTPGAELLDTLSFYDDSEPHWNERPYFSAVERKRGKTGVHINTSLEERTFEEPDPLHGRYLLPGPDSSAIGRELKYENTLGRQCYRVILSGIGGDEVLGGLPTPLPELANYLVSGDIGQLLQQATQWCLATRVPFLHLLWDTAQFVLTLYQRQAIDRTTIPSWMPPYLQDICHICRRTDPTSTRRFGYTPSSICNGLAWWTIIEALPNRHPGVVSRREYRYPYLDRDLIDYLFRIPRQQLVKPGRRRSLMRSALTEIVPTEILERRRKAYLVRGPLLSLREKQKTIEELLHNSLAAQLGYLDPDKLQVSLARILKGTEGKAIPCLMRAIAFELWLRANRDRLRF